MLEMRSPLDGFRSPFGRRSGDNPYASVPSGYVAEWRFSEGSGSTVADTTGAYNINLTTPTSPNATWNGGTIDLAAGLVQTPSITGAKTVAMLVKTTRGNTTGFELSGGAAGSGSGWLGNSIEHSSPTPASTWYTGYNAHAPFRRDSNGTSAREMNRGGWRLVIRTHTVAGNYVYGFGGRHSTTTSRVANFSIAAAWVWDRALDATERADLYTAARQIAVSKGFYIDWRDCPAKADAVLLWGQSNADGRAKIVDLSAGDQARTFTRTFITPSSFAATTYPYAVLDLGANQQRTAPTTDFGPEIGIAIQREDTPTGRDLYISKGALGSTYLDASANAVSTAGTTWSEQELPGTAGLYTVLEYWYDMQQYALEQGLGLELKAALWMQGEQDSTNAGAAGRYEANLGTFYPAIKNFTGYSSLPIVVGKIRTGDVSMTESATVRAAQAAFVAANSGTATLIDGDAFGLAADSVHFSAAGQISLGTAFYDAVF